MAITKGYNSINQKSKILITGGTGFIGSHMIDKLVLEGFHEIHSADRQNNKLLTSIKNKNCTYHKLDLTIKEDVDNLFEREKFDAVVHFAGNANVSFSHDFPEMDFDINVKGAFNILNSALKFSIKKFVFTSTAAVYGEPTQVPVVEDDAKFPVSNYGVAKLYGELLGMAYFNTHQLGFTAIRIFNTYGPRQPRYILFDIFKKLKSNPDYLEVMGTGEQIRDYCYISDTVHAFFLALTNPKSSGKIYNLSGGNPINILDLISLISDAMGLSPKVICSNESWKGDIKVFSASIDRIKDELGFFPMVPLKEGIESSIGWLDSNI